MKNSLLPFLILLFSFASLKAQNSSAGTYKLGVIGQYELDRNGNSGLKAGLVVERCARLGWRGGIVLHSWQADLQLDVFRMDPGAYAGDYVRAYYGQETFSRILFAGVPVSLHYSLSKRIRVNAGLQTDFLVASRSHFRTQQGFETDSKTSGHSAFVSPNFSGLAGIDFRLREGLWLNMQYQAGLRPLQLQRTVEPLIEYDFNGPGLRRQHFQVGLVLFLLHFEDSGQ